MRHDTTLRAAVLIAASALLLCCAAAAEAQTAPLPNGQKVQLAEMYAPRLYLHPEENFYPVSVEYALSRSHLMRHTGSADHILIDRDPSEAMISRLTDPQQGYYLDNRMGTIDDDGIAEDFHRTGGSHECVVHARVVQSQSNGYAIQYWFYYPFNDGPLNGHEGDWEMITVILDSSQSPVRVGYSQHYGGESAPWSMVPGSDNHPNVYVALGSHANYLRDYEGAFGLASDRVSSYGRVLNPEDYTIVLVEELGEGTWVDFAGYWGDYGSANSGVRGERGPQGPAYFQNGGRWTSPSAWVESLDVVSESKLQMSWWLANFVWMGLAAMSLYIVVKAFRLHRLKKMQGTLGPMLMPFAYARGIDGKSIGLVLGAVALAVAMVGFFLPLYSVSIDIEEGDYATDGEVEILVIDGNNGLRLSSLRSGAGLAQVLSAPVPFAWLLAFSVATFLVSTIGIQKSRKMGAKLLSRGIGTIASVALVVICVSVLASMVVDSSVKAPEEMALVMDEISDNPVWGSTTQGFGDYGEARLSWGLGIGAYLFIAAGILYVVAGLFQLLARCDYYPLPGEAAQPPTPQTFYGQPSQQPSQPPYVQTQPYEPSSQPYGQQPQQAQPSQYPPQGNPQAPPQSMTCPYCRANIALSGSTQPFPCPGCGNTLYPPQ